MIRPYILYFVGEAFGCGIHGRLLARVWGCGTALSQLWFFWAAPIVGALLAGIAYQWLGKADA